MIERKKLVLAGVIACFTACAGDVLTLFILAGKYPGYNQLFNTISSLGASESPVSSIISLWWVILGVLIISFAFGFRAAFSPGNKYITVAFWLLIIYGLGEGIASGLFKADLVHNSMTLSYGIHDILGGAGVVCILVLPLVVQKVDQFSINPGFRKLSHVVFVLGMLIQILFTFRFFGAGNNFPGKYTGLWQRLFLLMYYTYMIIIAIKMIVSMGRQEK
ncbi:MAG TPA: DUF998 domain-containing protein [Bacteroidales bacterium]|jgi:hypothetical protein|nr:DUF998 domain-containing protein [Bacteroidales bacterium]HQJ81978.1 DUF998 domain-containing protein [Bacteroidales bacterium]